MTCPRLDEVLTEAPAAGALAHAQGCAECGPARAAWDALNGSAGPSGSLEKIRAAARAELKAQPRARRWWADAATLLAINLGVAVVAASMMTAPPGPAQSPLSRWGIGAALLLLIIAGAWAAVRPAARPLRLSVLAIAVLGAIGVGVGGSGVGDAAGFPCALTEALVSLVPLAVAGWITSRFAWDLTRALVAGASVGASGLFVLHLHCANGTSAHLFAFHVLPWALVVLGAAAVRRGLPSRSYAP